MENNVLAMQQLISARLGGKVSITTTISPKEVLKPEKVKEAPIHEENHDNFAKFKERIQRRIQKFFEHSPSLNDNERLCIKEFLLSDENIREMDGYINLKILGTSALRSDFDSSSKIIHGKGIFAVVRENYARSREINLCIPSHSVRIALSDWIIYQQKLQVKGIFYQKDLPAEKEIESDREYLNLVLKRMTDAGVIAKITDAIHACGDITKVNVNLLTSLPAIEYWHLSTDAMEYSERLAKMKRNSVCFTYKMKDTPIFSMYGKEYAAISPYQLNIYFYTNKKGYNQLELYIPETEMEEYLAF